MSAIQENQTVENQKPEAKGWTFHVPSGILGVEGLKPNEKLVYMVLCSYADYETRECEPAYKSIAERSSLSRRTVINVIESLVKKGLLHKTIRYTDKDETENTSNGYKLVEPAPLRSKYKKESKPSANITPPVVQEFHHPSEEFAPKHNLLTKTSLTRVSKYVADSGESADSSESVSKPSEKEKTETPKRQYEYHYPKNKEIGEGVTEEEGNAIYEALERHALNNCYKTHGKLMDREDIDSIYLMLISEFTYQLDPALVKKACDRYIQKTDPEFFTGKLAFNLQNSTLFFKERYREAIALWKKGRFKGQKAGA